jgi:hypothetical protein
MVFLQGIKCTIFVNQSTITNITSKVLEDGKLVIKSMETKDQGCFGIGNGCKSPYKQYQGFFDLEQVSQDNTNFLMAFHIWGHQKSLKMSSNVLLNPKCPAARKS